MEGTTAFAAFSSVLAASTPDLPEKGFEIRALDEQANSLLQLVNHTAAQLDDARALLNQKSGICRDSERRMFQDTFQHTEDTICHIATLAQRPRSDMEVLGGRTRVSTRVLYVLRDSPRMQMSLSLLRSASKELNTTIVQLNSRHPRQSPAMGHSPPHDGPLLRENDQSPPPAYEDSVRHFLTEGRRRNMARRASAMAFAASTPSSPGYDRSRSSSTMSVPIMRVPTIPDLDIPELADSEVHRPLSMPTPPMDDLKRLPSRQGRASYRLSLDMSIPEVLQSKGDQTQHLDAEISPESSKSTPSSIDLRSDIPTNSTKPVGRLEGGRKTGRARAELWLQARTLG